MAAREMIFPALLPESGVIFEYTILKQRFSDSSIMVYKFESIYDHLFPLNELADLPHKQKRFMCIADKLQATCFSLEKILQKRVGDQFSFITKGSVYYIKYV